MSEEKSILEQNIEMWEKMTGSYMDSMFKTMEKTMEQSTVLQERINQAVSRTVNTQLEATLSTIKAMERQLEALNQKVDHLLKQEEDE
jgi:hypothetical protein